MSFAVCPAPYRLADLCSSRHDNCHRFCSPLLHVRPVLTSRADAMLGIRSTWGPLTPFERRASFAPLRSSMPFPPSGRAGNPQRKIVGVLGGWEGAQLLGIRVTNARFSVQSKSLEIISKTRFRLPRFIQTTHETKRRCDSLACCVISYSTRCTTTLRQGGIQHTHTKRRKPPVSRHGPFGTLLHYLPRSFAPKLHHDLLRKTLLQRAGNLQGMSES